MEKIKVNMKDVGKTLLVDVAKLEYLNYAKDSPLSYRADDFGWNQLPPQARQMFLDRAKEKINLIVDRICGAIGTPLEDSFVCGVCGGITKSTDYDKSMQSAYADLKKQGVCEECVRRG